MKFQCLIALLLLVSNPIAARAVEAVWQWSVPVKEGRAFLWIPGDCAQVRAVIVGQHNMSEAGVFEHPVMRREFAQLGIAEVWIAPPAEVTFDFNHGAGERFGQILCDLADVSGYAELASVPVIPIGHSACASYPWNFAAWNPRRTLAVISLHGDAPLTNLTGSGRPNPDWSDRTLDGVPGLMMMAEYEWLEGRLDPAAAYRSAHPGAPIAMLAEPGTGHFDVSEDAIKFLAMFIRKAVHYRLSDEGRELKPIDPRGGWLVQRWRKDEKRTVPPAPAVNYTGDKADAFWAFDEEMARAIQDFRVLQTGKKPQLLGWVQDGQVLPQSATHNQVSLRFEPQADGITFNVGATFRDSIDGGSPNTTRWTGLPPGAPIGHATNGGPVLISPITGPVVQISPDTFRVQLNRTASTVDRRSNDIWLLASHEGDDRYKSARQQALLKLPPNDKGQPQFITFPEIPDQKAGTGTVALTATSDAGVPVSYYVREGPAYVEGSTLHFTALPPRSRFPVRIVVVAWQWGRGTEPSLQAAQPVERSVFFTRP